LAGFAGLLALVLVGRLYMLQVVHAETYQSIAKNQYVETNATLFDRGSIFFKDKAGSFVSAATLQSGFIIAIEPDKIVDTENTFTQLHELLPALDHGNFLKAVAKKGDPYEEIAKRIPEEIGNEIDALELPGVHIYRERWRYYPGEDLASHTVGFIAFKEDTLGGRYGIERSYNDTLTRRSSDLYVNFFAEVFANLNQQFFTAEHKKEGDVVTTIEPTVQGYLERTLKSVGDEYGSKTTAGIIMDPKTGEILALGAYPTFDLNTFEASDVDHYKNPLVENLYEFGSIVKPITLAAGLDAGAVTAATTYNDVGRLTLDRATISNFDGKGRGVVPMQEVLSQSLNTGATFVMQEMGKDMFREYLRKFGIMEETGIDLPNEASPLVDNLDSPRMIEYATASFGQGFATTPVAMAKALATLANGGVVPQPHVVSDILYAGGLAKHIAWGQETSAISPQSAEELTRMLVEVVDTALLDGKAKQERYSVAAKTGTAQISNPDGGGYYDDRYLHSFFGYFPAYDARFLIFLFTVEPVGVRYASETLTHPFLDLTKFLISYYEIPPDR
jgi:cell division protein FtsI/penicillin-binding protein 2